jgi:hypothetical protein
MEPYDFSQETIAFEKLKAELLKTCEGKFAVLKGDNFLGAFDTWLAAYQAGIKAWGNVPFLIKPVLEHEHTEFMPALVLGLIHVNL